MSATPDTGRQPRTPNPSSADATSERDTSLPALSPHDDLSLPALQRALRNPADQIPPELYTLKIPLTRMVQHLARPEILIAEDDRGAPIIFVAPLGTRAAPETKGILAISAEPRQVHDLISIASSAMVLHFRMTSSQVFPDGIKRPVQNGLFRTSLGSYGSAEDRFKATVSVLEGAVEGARVGFGAALSLLPEFRARDSSTSTRVHANSTPMTIVQRNTFSDRVNPALYAPEPYRIQTDWRPEAGPDAHDDPSCTSQRMSVEVLRRGLLGKQRLELTCEADVQTMRLAIGTERRIDKGTIAERVFADDAQLSAFLLGFTEGYIAARLLQST